jgi:hypothetical protein
MKKSVGPFVALIVLVGASHLTRAQSQSSEQAVQSQIRDVRDRLQRGKIKAVPGSIRAGALRHLKKQKGKISCDKDC